MVQRYEATQTGLDRSVEIRVSRKLLPEGSPDETRWKLVIKTLATSDHASLLKVLDTGAIEGHPYYVVDLRDASSFEELRAEARRPLPADRVLSVGRRLAEALGQLHSKGLLLRDLTAASVFYDRSKDLPYVAYYHGLRTFDEGGALRDDERELLSPSFLNCPEAIRGLPTSPRTDLYMLAAMLYHLVTGKNPLDREMVYGKDGVNPAWDFPLASEIVPGVHEALAGFLGEVLRAAPEERPADAAAFVESIDRAATRIDVADQLSKSMIDARKAVTLDLSASMARKADQKKKPSSTVEPRASVLETIRNVGADPKLQLMGMIGVPLLLVGGVAFMLIGSGDGGSTAVPPAPTRPQARPTATRSLPRPPTGKAQKGQDLAQLAKEVEALSNELSGTPTSKKNFLKRWNVLKRWIILVPVSQRKQHLFSYAQIVNAKILYFSNAEKACKDLDAFIEKAGSYLRTNVAE